MNWIEDRKAREDEKRRMRRNTIIKQNKTPFPVRIVCININWQIWTRSICVSVCARVCYTRHSRLCASTGANMMNRSPVHIVEFALTPHTLHLRCILLFFSILAVSRLVASCHLSRSKCTIGNKNNSTKATVSVGQQQIILQADATTILDVCVYVCLCMCVCFKHDSFSNQIPSGINIWIPLWPYIDE